MSETKDQKKKNIAIRHPWILLLIAVCIAVGLWELWGFYGLELAHQRVVSLATASSTAKTPEDAEKERIAYFAEVGQTGDAFGGLNALLTAIAGALVAWAGYMQYLSLQEARQEAKRATEEAIDERRSRQRQEFESLFFQMLTLSRDLSGLIEERFGNGPRSSPNGDSAFDKLANGCLPGPLSYPTPEEAMKAAVRKYNSEVYESYPSTFGPYFRVLFQIFKLVNEAALEEKEKIRYANIARGQISESAVLLLALNGLTYRGWKFVYYIEKFGLLEHMHPTIREYWEAPLLTGYRERAFLGSQRRESYNLEREPLKPIAYFSTSSHPDLDAIMF